MNFLVSCVLSIFLAAVCAYLIESVRNTCLHAWLSGGKTMVVYVRPGDTLWGIAESCGSGSGLATTEIVMWIRDENHLETSALGVGQCLRIPVFES